MKDPNYPELIATDAGNFRPMGIRNLSPGLVERGKIKIGQKGQVRTSRQGNQFQPPQKLDYFLVTSMERGDDGNFLHDREVMQLLGDRPREIPVRLVYDDIDLNFPSRYAAYAGKTLWCTGDGQQARRANVDERRNIVAGHHLVQCPCPRQDPTYTGPDKCKITGTLSVIIDGADVVGGVWKFRTTSYNSVVGILSSLAMIKRITGGRLAGIPLVMKLSPKAVNDPIKGSQQTVYVVSLEYRGSVQSLRDAGYAALMEDKTHGARIEHIEDQARALLADRRDEYEADADDIVDEFYPDQARDQADAGDEQVAVGKSPARHRSFQGAGTTPTADNDNNPPLEGEVVTVDPEPEKPKRQPRKTAPKKTQQAAKPDPEPEQQQPERQPDPEPEPEPEPEPQAAANIPEDLGGDDDDDWNQF